MRLRQIGRVPGYAAMVSLVGLKKFKSHAEVKISFDDSVTRQGACPSSSTSADGKRVTFYLDDTSHDSEVPVASSQFERCGDEQGCPYDKALRIAESRILDRLRTRQGSAALLSVRVDGREITNTAFGTSDEETGQPATSMDRMRVGSITMALTAAHVLNYCYDNQVDINEKCRIQDNSGRCIKAKYTIKDLLDHRGGIKPSTVCHTGSNRPIPNNVSHLDDLLKTAVDSPGKFKFTSNGYNILGTFLRQRHLLNGCQLPYPQLFNMLNVDFMMPSTEMEVFSHLIPHFAKHYTSMEREAPFVDCSDKFASSGLVSTASDLTKFAEEVLFHEQKSSRDSRVCHLRHCLKIWMPDMCLKHSPRGCGETSGVDESQNSDNCYQEGDTTSPCVGYTNGWSIRLTETCPGSKHRYTVVASNEALGTAHSSALVVRYRQDNSPFPTCDRAAALVNDTSVKPGCPGNEDRVTNRSKGIVVAVLMNGANLNAGDIATELAQNIDLLAHK